MIGSEEYHEDQQVSVDTMIVEQGELITLRPNITDYEGYGSVDI